MARVRLSSLCHDDAGALVAFHVQNRAFHAPWVSPFTDMDAFEPWFAQRVTGNHVTWLAREVSTDAIAGVFNLGHIVMGPLCSAYLGYYGAARLAGKGYMTEALGLVVRAAFDDLGLHRIEANIQPGNAASIALARRAGFRKEGFSPRYLKIGGQWRDHERWAILADEG